MDQITDTQKAGHSLALLGETLTPPLLAGAPLTVGGVILAERWWAQMRAAPLGR